MEGSPPEKQYWGTEPQGLRARFTPLDWVLFALTIYLSLFALMFLNNPTIGFVENTGRRRAIMLFFLVVEVVAVVLIVRAVA